MPIAIAYTRHFNTPAEEAPSAPTGPFEVGTEVGVPTGTSLTNRTSLGSPTASETVELAHPVTGAELSRSASVWRNIRFTQTISPAPAAGAMFWFDRCEFNVNAEFFAVDVIDTNGVADIMQPLALFTDCTFTGNDTSSRCLNGGFLWLVRCDLNHAEDGFGGVYYSVVQDCNIICTTDGQADPHADGIQIGGIGQSAIYHTWMDSGDDSASSNAPLRIGTEFSAVNNVDIRYCGFAGTQHGLQVRGDSGSGDISNITVIGCRWVDEQVHGPTDFAETTDVTWSDNAFMDGTPIPNPVP